MLCLHLTKFGNIHLALIKPHLHKVNDKSDFTHLLDIGDTLLYACITVEVQIPVPKCQQPPSHSKQQPAAQESHGENDQGETPFEIHQSGEHVLQESALLSYILVRQVTCAALGDEARFVYAVPKHGLSGHPRQERRYSELIRNDTFTWQHYLVMSVRMVKKKWLSKSAPRLSSAQQKFNIHPASSATLFN